MLSYSFIDWMWNCMFQTKFAPFPKQTDTFWHTFFAKQGKILKNNKIDPRNGYFDNEIVVDNFFGTPCSCCSRFRFIECNGPGWACLQLWLWRFILAGRRRQHHPTQSPPGGCSSLWRHRHSFWRKGGKVRQCFHEKRQTPCPGSSSGPSPALGTGEWQVFFCHFHLLMHNPRAE